MWHVHQGSFGGSFGAMLASSTLAMVASIAVVEGVVAESVAANNVAVIGVETNRAARACAEAADAPQPLRIRIVPSGTPVPILAIAQAEVAGIWRPYRVAIEWVAEKVTASSVQPDLFVYFVDERVTSATRHRSPAIAWIPFANGVPLHYVRVSWPAALAILQTESWVDGKSLVHAQPRVQHEALGRIVGRALAHEIGHYLLGSRHAEHGLMRAALDNRELVHPGSRYPLQDNEVRTLRAARLATCETLARSHTQ